MLTEGEERRGQGIRGKGIKGGKGSAVGLMARQLGLICYCGGGGTDAEIFI